MLVQPGRSIREGRNFDIGVGGVRDTPSHSVPAPLPAEPPYLAPLARYTPTTGGHRTKWRKLLMLQNGDASYTGRPASPGSRLCYLVPL